MPLVRLTKLVLCSFTKNWYIRPYTNLPSVAKAYNRVDRNAFLFGWTPPEI
ncbi:hypothetical protein [Nostoc sp.]|uniref:hypothetical protein n=1 Tax=Nostoc sp. TaxID=1180 RepID=UPI003FA5ADC1